MGRPTKLTPEIEAQILKLVRGHNYAETAARACGISKDTFRSWVTMGQKGHRRFRAFSQAIDEAMAISEVKLVAEASNGGPKGIAALAILERKHCHTWGRRVALMPVADGETSGVRRLDVSIEVLEPRPRQVVDATASSHITG